MFRCAKPASSHLYVAQRALQERLDGLLKPLRDGVLAAEGIPFRDTSSTRILRSIWSHGDFRLNLETGDVFEENPESTNWSDLYLKRWSGLMIVRPNEQAGDRDPCVPVATYARARRKPKSDGVRAALEATGIDMATDLRGPSAIAYAIADHVPWPVSKEHEVNALIKTISRLKRRLD